MGDLSNRGTFNGFFVRIIINSISKQCFLLLSFNIYHSSTYLKEGQHHGPFRKSDSRHVVARLLTWAISALVFEVDGDNGRDH